MISASSSGLLLKTLGLKVTAIKIDPYLNIDAGTMSPKEHGECFVLKGMTHHEMKLGISTLLIDLKMAEKVIWILEIMKGTSLYCEFILRMLTLPERYVGLNLTAEVSSCHQESCQFEGPH